MTASDGQRSKRMQADTNLLPSQMQKKGQKDDGPVCGLLGSSTTHITERLNGVLMTTTPETLNEEELVVLWTRLHEEMSNGILQGYGKVTPVDPCNGSDSVQTHPAKPNSKVEKKKVALLGRQEKSRWEVLQQEQRLIEEKNKRKKALLAKAIAERSKRTQAETVKLKRIQKELQALDDMVSADIGILRNRIDQASLDYSYARKRYDKAESEYVAAKLDLQHKTEIKEHLTEHLCTIIQQNELRKARKLEELMQQLEVEADEENLELEIEVERMLQQQEAEAGRQASQSHNHAGTAKENPTASVTARESEHANCAVASPAISEQLVQSENSGTESLSNMDSQTLTVNVTPGNPPACSDT
ncbi:RAB6-interacting golgin [Egretta garzetta]|uniref:RAB6-interacting golgin n=1 Tax=Egretta garzetta TaxID=188379 RepID=UPI00163B8FB1|nr:RAB6-interacting golgin [Egretta garzetta]